ncbi:tyrosine-type recombinase/integrase [Butyrivibrio sp. JL13D10]|uniref:tyrosine-type recombinase/integrase n=1 Tax=Butyrivibrio sp. JL13D10 TaxID=3236815 RepID=UPI0038B5C437
MARPRKDGRRAEGIYGKHGSLYIVTCQKRIDAGVTKYDRIWQSTGLADTPENVKIASEARLKQASSKSVRYVDKNIILSDYIDIYLSQKERDIADTTFSAYVYRANRIKRHMGSIKVKDVKKESVEVFLDALFTEDNMQPRTVKDTKVFLTSILDQAVNDGLIAWNPAEKAKINKKLSDKHAKSKNDDDDFFSYDEVQLFLKKTKGHKLRNLFYFTVVLGLRREEVLGLRWSAVDLKRKKLVINHTVTRGLTVNRINATKTASSRRTYPLKHQQIAILQKIKAEEENNRKLCGNGYYESDYIFKHEDGTLYYPDYPSKEFRKVLKSIPELPQGVTLHGLRKSCVSLLVHDGMDIKRIQSFVGHKDVDTTLRIYAKVKDKESKLSCMDTMDDLIDLDDFLE